MYKNTVKRKFKQLITLGKKKGYLTYKEIIDRLEGEDCKEELIDNFFIRLVELGIKATFLDPIAEKILERKKQELLEYLIPIGKAQGYLTYEEIDSGFLSKISYEEKISGCLEESKKDLYTKIEEKGIKILEQNVIKEREFLKKILTIGKEKGYLTYNEIDELYLEEKHLVYNDINELYTKIREKEIKIVEQNLKVDAIKRKKQEVIEKLVSIDKERGYLTYNEINNELFQKNLNYSKENRKYILSIYRILGKLEIKIIDRTGKKLFENLISIGKRYGYVVFDDIREEIYEKNLKIETLTYFHAIQKIFGFKVIIAKKQIFDYLNQLLTNLNCKKNTSEEKLVPLQNNEKISNGIIDNNLGILFENNNGDIVLKSKDRALDNIFNKLDEKQQDMIIKRYYYEESLEDIGKKYKITRERARQILVKIENKLFNVHKPDINRFLLEFTKNISNLNIATKKELYESLKNYGNPQILVIYINYFINKYIKDKDFLIAGNINLNKIKEILESISVVTIEYIYKQLKIKFNISSEIVDKLLVIFDKFILKKGYLINPTLPNKILYLFYIEQRPIHISELENLYKREFNSTNVIHNLYAQVQKLSEISRYDRGTYVLKESISNQILCDKDFIKKIMELLESRNKILHINFIKEKILSKYSLGEIKYLLESNKHFKNFGMEYYGLAFWENKTREHIKDIIYKYIKYKKKPVNLYQIEQYLKKCGKNTCSRSLHSFISRCDNLKKIAPNVWGLKRWKQYPAYETLNVSKNIKRK